MHCIFNFVASHLSGQVRRWTQAADPRSHSNVTSWTDAWLVVVFCKITEWWSILTTPREHDDVIKWKHFPRHCPYVRGIYRSPVNSPHKGQWRGALMFSLICVWINGWINNREAGDLTRYRAHYDVIVMNGQSWVASTGGVKGKGKLAWKATVLIWMNL